MSLGVRGKRSQRKQRSNPSRSNKQRSTRYPMDELKTRWREQQRSLKRQLIKYDDWAGFDHLRLVGGVDISFVKGNDVDACAALVVLSYPAMEVVYEDMRMVQLDQPYIAGYLAFREVPLLAPLIQNLQEQAPEFVPDVILCDGNGILHYRGFGLASQLGVVCNIPTIGVAKELLYVDGLNRELIKQFYEEKRLERGGDYVHLVGESSSEILGACVRTTSKTKKAVYVSIGHKVSLETAIRLAVECSHHKLPEPVRQADLRSRRVIRKYERGELKDNASSVL